jgi:D-threonate/D-erythronate kinase
VRRRTAPSPLGDTEPHGPQIGVLADDLTGALGSAARLRDGGLETLVVWRAEELPEAFRPRAVVVDMRTRDAPAGPRATALAWSRRLRELGCARFEQRIDSTLRGAPAEELAGLLEGAGLGDAVVIAVPAFPDAGRVCVGGRQRAAGTSREVEVAPALFGPDASVDVVAPGDLADRVRAGDATRFVVDGADDDDLRVAAEAVGALERDGVPVVTSSPGGWLRHHPVAAGTRAEFVLVVLGSNTAGNHRQLDALRDGREAVVVVPAGAGDPAPGSDPLAAGGATVVVETISGSEPDDERRDPRLADHAADAAAALLGRAHERGLHCRGVVASGGHMASRLVDALAADCLGVLGEVAPLCPRAMLAGGPWSGLPVVTKGGLVGEDGTLALLVDDLWREDGWKPRDPRSH